MILMVSDRQNQPPSKQNVKECVEFFALYIRKRALCKISVHESNSYGHFSLKKNYFAGQWWDMPLIPAFGRQRQADFWIWDQPGLQSEFQDIQGYTEKPCLKKPKKKKKNKNNCQCHPRAGIKGICHHAGLLFFFNHTPQPGPEPRSRCSKIVSPLISKQVRENPERLCDLDGFEEHLL